MQEQTFPYIQLFGTCVLAALTAEAKRGTQTPYLTNVVWQEQM